MGFHVLDPVLSFDRAKKNDENLKPYGRRNYDHIPVFLFWALARTQVMARVWWSFGFAGLGLWN
jgi:hypothetical protein